MIINSIKANPVMSYGSRALQHNVGPNKDVKNLSGESCDIPNYVNWIGLDCMSVCCMGAESYIKCLLGKSLDLNLK